MSGVRRTCSVVTMASPISSQWEDPKEPTPENEDHRIDHHNRGITASQRNINVAAERVGKFNNKGNNSFKNMPILRYIVHIFQIDRYAAINDVYVISRVSVFESKQGPDNGCNRHSNT